MTQAHLHLMLNHFPVVLMVVGVLVLTVALPARMDRVARAAFWGFLLAAVVAVPAYLTGEGAEELMEAVGVVEEVVEAHEDFALNALIGLLILGLLSGVGLWFYRDSYRRMPRWFVVSVWVVALVVAGLTSWTAYLGGQIRHQELRPGFEVPAEAGEEGEAPAPEAEEGEGAPAASGPDTIAIGHRAPPPRSAGTAGSDTIAADRRPGGVRASPGGGRGSSVAGPADR